VVGRRPGAEFEHKERDRLRAEYTGTFAKDQASTLGSTRRSNRPARAGEMLDFGVRGYCAATPGRPRELNPSGRKFLQNGGWSVPGSNR
jgi:hypothetical protein